MVNFIINGPIVVNFNMIDEMSTESCFFELTIHANIFKDKLFHSYNAGDLLHE